MPLEKAKESFKFYTRLNLTELTGFRASNLRQMLRYLKSVPASCIYHHTHRSLQQRHYLSPEPPNDFAYWVSNVLGEKELGEKLASIDIARFEDLESLRDAIIEVIGERLKKSFLSGFRHIDKSEAFYFMKSISFILPTPYIVDNLKDFIAVIKNIMIDSIYFHMFEIRLRLGHDMNDFSNWIKNSLENDKLADALDRIDPYTHTLDELRSVIVRIVEKHIGA